MKELKDKIQEIILETNEGNYSFQYEKIIGCVCNYVEGGISKEETESLLQEIDDELEMDDYQEDIFLELANSVGGFLSDKDNTSF